jgi:hypothetical protein
MHHGRSFGIHLVLFGRFSEFGSPDRAVRPETVACRTSAVRTNSSVVPLRLAFLFTRSTVYLEERK